MAQIEAVQGKSHRETESRWSREPARRGLGAVAAVFLWGVILAAAGALIFFTHLEPYCMLLLLGPAVLAAFLYPRGFFAFAIASTAAGEAALTLLKFNYIDRSVLPLVLTVPLAYVMAEVVFLVTRSRRKTDMALRESEARFRRFVEQSNDGILLVDHNGVLTEWNRSLETISGIKRADAIDRPYWDLAYKMLPEELRNRTAYERIKGAVKELLQTGHMTGASLITEREIVRSDASRRRVQELVFPIQVENGYLAGSILRDVSDRTAAELAQKEMNEKLTLSVQELRLMNQEAVILNEMGDMLQSCLTVEDAYEVLRQFAVKIFPTQPGILYVLNDSVNLFEAKAAWGTPVGDGTTFALDGCWAIRRGRTHLVSESSNRLICQHVGAVKDPTRIPPYVCIPMTAQGETLGVMHIQAPVDEEKHDTAELATKLEAQAAPLAVRVALALANLRLRETLRMQSIRDPLTGLFNRRYMEETLDRELHRAARHKNPLGVLMIDIDHFKRFNDTFGHDIGDALLQELGAFVRANVRSEDVPCRYGGEEFIVILPEASLEDTYKRALQLRQGLTGLKLQRRGQSIGPVTVSQGVAGFPEHGASASQILQAADAALYRAKRGGRDRAVVAEV
jgi:diguanylate cyclase (GGDEF)-like protein/PAS domain S-box-containing protein